MELLVASRIENSIPAQNDLLLKSKNSNLEKIQIGGVEAQPQRISSDTKVGSAELDLGSLSILRTKQRLEHVIQVLKFRGGKNSQEKLPPLLVEE